MERLSIKKYAATHKLSMFNVVKMLKSGELKSETVEESGKEVTYILIDRQEKREITKETTQGQAGLEEKVRHLEQDVAILKRELDALKMSMGIR